MSLNPQQLAQEANAATKALVGKVVVRVLRHRDTEVLVEFEDGSRLFVDRGAEGVEISVTGGRSRPNPEEAP